MSTSEHDRIYEEERARHKARLDEEAERKAIAAKQKRTADARKMYYTIFFLILIAIAITYMFSEYFESFF